MTALLDSPSLVERYFDAWNARDPDAVAGAFAAGGTYTDPTVGGPPLAGTAIAEHARALLAAFPAAPARNSSRSGGAAATSGASNSWRTRP